MQAANEDPGECMDLLLKHFPFIFNCQNWANQLVNEIAIQFQVLNSSLNLTENSQEFLV